MFFSVDATTLSVILFKLSTRTRTGYIRFAAISLTIRWNNSRNKISKFDIYLICQQDSRAKIWIKKTRNLELEISEHNCMTDTELVHRIKRGRSIRPNPDGRINKKPDAQNFWPDGQNRRAENNHRTEKWACVTSFVNRGWWNRLYHSFWKKTGVLPSTLTYSLVLYVCHSYSNYPYYSHRSSGAETGSNSWGRRIRKKSVKVEN